LFSLFDISELSVMGIAEIAPKYFSLKRRISQTADDILAQSVDVLITIDSPDFCLRVAKILRAKRSDLPILHYVAPSVWAWRPKRAVKMARLVDHVLALLPFEPSLMQAVGLSCDFVGHPVVARPLGLSQKGDDPIILVLPGSRRGEIARLTPVMGSSLELILPHHPKLRVLLPSLPHLVDQLRYLVKDWPIAPKIITDLPGKADAFASASVAIAASGTVSLELAANRVPMVVAYDMHPITLWLMTRMALIDTVTLVNLVSETRLVPEFIGRNCRAELIAPAVLAQLADPTAQLEAMDFTMARLGKGGIAPGVRAARSVWNFLEKRTLLR
jgi:lipid-A-disaccharide synthase